jgi:hypothetical protein
MLILAKLYYYEYIYVNNCKIILNIKNKKINQCLFIKFIKLYYYPNINSHNAILK